MSKLWLNFLLLFPIVVSGQVFHIDYTIVDLVKTSCNDVLAQILKFNL